MFLTRRALLLLGVLASFAVWPADAQLTAKKVADYQVGDTALSNIVARSELVVIDREASAALRQKEALKIPAIVRFNPRVTEDAVSRLRSAFALARDQFVVEMAAKFGGRRRLEETQINSAGFRQFRTAFQNDNKGFPVTLALASAWAAGGTGDDVEQSMIARLQEFFGERRLRADELPPEIREGPGQVRLLTLLPGAAAPPLDELEKTGELVPRASLKPVNTARNEALRNQPQPKGDRPFAIFLARLVEPNCTFDLELTRQLRARRTQEIWSADRYAAGQVIVRAGEPVTRKIKAALDELAAQTAVTELRRAPWQPVKYWPLILISLSTGLLATGLIVFFLSRRLEPRMDAILVQTGGVLAAGESRALLGDASGKVSDMRPNQAEREAARPHLEKALKDKLVNELLTQRKDLIETQREAEADIAALEERLTQLHAPLQARLDAYEQRIGELEKDLATRGDENKELISATIVLMKQKLETEKSGPHVRFN